MERFLGLLITIVSLAGVVFALIGIVGVIFFTLRRFVVELRRRDGDA